ncbi:MAG: hypothetical protein IID18_04770 [Nitrospinae bacterium]|nr:hypothetical protein [Nitrospinota bacterium]
MDSIAQYYREINSGFLNQEMPQKFDIFTQVENGDEPRFMKFTDYTIDNHDKIRDLLEQGDGQSYFIHENDLIKYYKDNLIKISIGNWKRIPIPVNYWRQPMG